jgi:hypothetical protein
MSQGVDNTPPNDNGSSSSEQLSKTVDTKSSIISSLPKLTGLQEIPKVPSLRESINDFVKLTNTTLSTMESKYQETIQAPMTQAVHQLSDTTMTLSEQLNQLYEKRYVYGPYAIVGSSLLVGGIATVRRGRISGIVSTLMVGGLSYGIIYGLDDTPTMSGTSLESVLPKSITDLWKSK